MTAKSKYWVQIFITLSAQSGWCRWNLYEESLKDPGWCYLVATLDSTNPLPHSCPHLESDNLLVAPHNSEDCPVYELPEDCAERILLLLEL